ncbi:MAG: helix-turn-helix transcriptional regulator [Candidatus Anammoximicrobium sp.]|nr:helix-turn-helix transcriptional regulator [Candidatus Anammoximicrobium sp.]
MQATERIVELMQEQDVTRTELAKRLGRTKGWISQLLAGEANFTLRTLADVFGALGLRPIIRPATRVTGESIPPPSVP